MVTYICEICNKTFDHKGNYERHINKKTSCADTLVYKNIEVNDGLTCEYCNNKFTRKHDLKRHMLNRCNLRKGIVTNNLVINQKEQQKIIEQLTYELQIIKQNQLIDKNYTITNKDMQIDINGNQNNIINNSNINSNNTNNITINVMAYGKENLSHLTDNDYKKIFNLCNSSVPEFIKLKHFDKEHPENSNVYIPNLTGTYGYMYDGEQWNAIEKQKLLSYLYDDNCDFLIDTYNAMQMSDNNSENDDIDKNEYYFSRFIDKHDKASVIKEVSKKIELIAYNNKDMAKTIRKLKK
jgi:hypothetical protein